MNDTDFIRVCEFFTKNNIELNIIVYETQNNTVITNKMIKNNITEDNIAPQKIE
jgi:hypothetical protein